MNPFLQQDYRTRQMTSVRDALLLGLDTAELRVRETLADVTDEEYDWEPLTAGERSADLPLPPSRKRVWRVFRREGAWTYDYTPEPLAPPPFTTIAWIMCHIATTTDMYLYCVQSGLAEGVARTWDDLPVPPVREAMSEYIFQALAAARAYLAGLDAEDSHPALNQLTPAPWGELRPTYLNLWGGVIEHTLQHAMQIAVRLERIRYRY